MRAQENAIEERELAEALRIEELEAERDRDEAIEDVVRVISRAREDLTDEQVARAIYVGFGADRPAVRALVASLVKITA